MYDSDNVQTICSVGFGLSARQLTKSFKVNTESTAWRWECGNNEVVNEKLLKATFKDRKKKET